MTASGAGAGAGRACPQIRQLADQLHHYGLAWLNAVFLLGQSFIPFPTAMMGEYSHNPLAVSMFGAVFAINTLLFLALEAYIPRHPLKPEFVGANRTRS